MFFQPPDQNSQPTKSTPSPRRKRKNKFSNKKKRGVQKDLQRQRHCRFSSTMSSWAEDFNKAATWQYKHQIAYWKSKAVALEYENKILHDIIKRNCLNTAQTVESDQSSSKSESVSDLEEENDDFEVSEEFIEFLRSNAKYKEDARRERERLKANTAEEKTIEYESRPEGDNNEKLKELYGRDWQRIAALEMSMKCTFINECDKHKPLYWPNIPFNFNYS